MPSYYTRHIQVRLIDTCYVTAWSWHVGL